VHLSVDSANRLCAAFPSPEFYVSPSAAREAVLARGQFNVIHPASGNKIDFMLARNDPWGRLQLNRRIRRPILPDQDGFVAAPEDVIMQNSGATTKEVQRNTFATSRRCCKPAVS
jgi:hypothetical protein